MRFDDIHQSLELRFFADRQRLLNDVIGVRVLQQTRQTLHIHQLIDQLCTHLIARQLQTLHR